MAPSLRDWSDPFLEQAREDLRGAWAVHGERRANCPSTLAMLLQMVFEKLAKAAFARSGQELPRSHGVASRLFLLLLRHPAAQQILQVTADVEQFVCELECAHPAVAGRCNPPAPQLEYPWADPDTGQVYYPARDLHLARRIQDPKDLIAARCLTFASALAKELPHMIP